jgi:hypothetical protein
VKRNLLIHNPTNEFTKNYREYNLFWDELTDELKEYHNVTENRYYESAHLNRMKIYLKNRTKEFLELYECEYVIEDSDSGEFWILSVSDQMTSAMLDEKENPYLKKVLYSQYIPDQIVHHTGEYSYKYIPWIYFKQDVTDISQYYEKRKKITDFIPKLFFKGLTSYRPIIDYIDSEIITDSEKIKNQNYFDSLIEHRVALSVGGAAVGDLCYRDIEYLSLGVPFIKFDFVATLNPSLIPNYHYISIPLQMDFPQVNDVLKDRLGEKKHAKLIEDRFKSVVNNMDFLNFVSRNARNYYEENLSPDVRIKKTFNILNLSNYKK